jgi:hypothetical protein
MAVSTVNISFQEDLLEQIDRIAQNEARTRPELLPEFLSRSSQAGGKGRFDSLLPLPVMGVKPPGGRDFLYGGGPAPSLQGSPSSLRVERSNPLRGLPCLDCFVAALLAMTGSLRPRNDGFAAPLVMTSSLRSWQ